MLHVVEGRTCDAKCYWNHVESYRHSFVDNLAVHCIDKAVFDPRKIKKLQAAGEPGRKPMVLLASISTSVDALHYWIIQAETNAWLRQYFSPELTLRGSQVRCRINVLFHLQLHSRILFRTNNGGPGRRNSENFLLFCSRNPLFSLKRV